MWRSSILDRKDPPNPETTGSSGILIGLAWGVNSGILDRQRYQPVVEKAWEGLTQLAVQKSGLLGYCQPVGGSPKPVILIREHTPPHGACCRTGVHGNLMSSNTLPAVIKRDLWP